MKIQSYVLLFLFLSITQYLFAGEIRKIENHELTRVLNYFENHAELDDLFKCPSSVRMFKLQDEGECSSKVPKCPKNMLYIAVASFGETYDGLLFVTSKHHEWQFIKTVACPTIHNRHVNLTLQFEYIDYISKGVLDKHTIMFEFIARGSKSYMRKVQ